VVSDLHRDHRRKDRADQVQEAGDVVHREEDGPGHADDRHHDGGLFTVQFGGQALGRDARRPGVQKRGGHGGEHQNHQRGNAKPGLDHDDGNVILAGENRRAHADDVHPAGHQPVDDDADPGGLGGLLGIAGIVADQRQPGQGHCHGQLHRCAKGQALTVHSGHHIAGEEDDLTQHQREDKQRGHRDFVDPAQVGDAHGDPQNNQCADDQAPHPAANVENAAHS